MEEKQKQRIIESGKKFFYDIIISNHLKNIEKLNLDSFNINPFIINYLAAFLCGNTTPESLAKALVYPRILGTSINTSFGANIQNWIANIAEITGGGSIISGIDIEFLDAIDGRKKYCQCKAGLQTINKDDVETVLNNFNEAKNRARINRLNIEINDLIVGILYGEGQLTPFYVGINEHYPVYLGATFWEHLTGDNTFYYKLTRAFGEVVNEKQIDSTQLIRNKIEQIANEIRQKGNL